MPDPSIDKLFQLALGHHQAGRLADAEPIYRQIVAFDPTYADAHHLLGLIALRTGRIQAALELVQKAIALYSDVAIYHNSLEQVLEELDQTEQAEAACRTALRLNPNYPEAHNNLGNLLLKRAKIEEAISSYQTAIRLDPNFATAYTNLGNIRMQQGVLNEALSLHRRAVELAPSVASFHSNLGNVLSKQKEFTRAIESYLAAIRLDPGYAVAHSNLGNAYSEQGDLDQAIACHRRAVDLQPGSSPFHSSLLMTMHYRTDYSPTDLAVAHRAWRMRHADPLKPLFPLPASRRDPSRRMRIGYVSPDLRGHAIARFMFPLLQNHDRKSFEIFCYADVPNPDATTDQLRAIAENWRDISQTSDAAVADLVRRDEIDLLIDLAAHSSHNRLLVFARKPAPVQATYLAYCSTTGLDTIDFRLSDWFFDPDGTDLTHYAEETIRLPETYWCCGAPVPPLQVNALPAGAAGHVTFGCLNNFCKVTDATLHTWARILTEIPGAQLLIYVPGDSQRQHVRSVLQSSGVKASRVSFVNRQPFAGYLGTYQKIDIGLDPFPFTGGTTTCDALWMGVPVVSLAGQTAVSRGGLSLLSNIGLSNLAAQTEDEYVRLAVGLGRDLEHLAQLRAELRPRLQASPVMDTVRFTKNIESAFREMWRRRNPDRTATTAANPF